jgi:hypothetical protein
VHEKRLGIIGYSLLVYVLLASLLWFLIFLMVAKVRGR